MTNKNRVTRMILTKPVEYNIKPRKSYSRGIYEPFEPIFFFTFF